MTRRVTRRLLCLSIVLLNSELLSIKAPAADPILLPNLAPDDESVICNHYPHLRKFPLPEVRCKDARVPGGMLLFTRGTKTNIDLPIQNDRKDSIQAQYTITEVNRQGTQLGQKTGFLTLIAGTAATVSYALDTASLKYGVYSLVLNVNCEGQTLTEREYYFGVISDTVIPKSQSNGFLYGLAPNYGGVIAKAPKPAEGGKRGLQGQCDLLKWIESSGADILRSAGFGIGPGAWAPDLDDLAVIHSHGLQVMGMAWPPEPNSKAPNGFFDSELQKWIAKAEDAARKAPDVIYWELGNEPDLGYKGGIERYIQIFEETSRAIKRGNPKALTMNGGITFFGEKGPANSRNFINLVKPESIDIIAYHAHGPGSLAERNIYEQVHKAALESGKGDKALIDTESGMFVGSKRQEEAQAWMVLQKQAYAQAVGLKFLMTFCLHAFRHGDFGYGMLRSDSEPNPAFVAYRAMTEHLKGLAFQNKLNMTQAHAEGYSFAEAAGPSRACVFWSNQAAFYNVYLKIAEAAKNVSNLRTMDIYGNTLPASVSAEGVVRVEVAEAPKYLLWDTSERQFQATVTRSKLRTPDMANVVSNVPTPLEIIVENPADTDLTATLSATICSQRSATITPEKQTVHVPGKKSASLRYDVKCTSSDQDLRWPETWTVFTDIDEAEVDIGNLRDAPQSINGRAGRKVRSSNGVVRLLRPGEFPREKRTGYIFGIAESDRDQVVRIGCSADWWMEFRVNGEIIESTMKQGNAGQTVTERILEVPLRRGKNLLAFKVLSGKGGWSVTLASPAELPALIDPAKATNCIDLLLESNGKELARERLALHSIQSIDPLNGLSWPGPTEQWISLPPDCTLEGANVVNLFDKLPDSSKFWHGDNDLSAKAWIRCDERRVYLLVRVIDDKDVIDTEPTKLFDADSLQIGISEDVKQHNSESGSSIVLFTIGRIKGKTAIYKNSGVQCLPNGLVPEKSSEIDARIERTEQDTCYWINLDRSLFGKGIFQLNFMVNDNDYGYRKQFIRWTDGLGSTIDPALWQQLTLGSNPRRMPAVSK